METLFKFQLKGSFNAIIEFTKLWSFNLFQTLTYFTEMIWTLHGMYQFLIDGYVSFVFLLCR